MSTRRYGSMRPSYTSKPTSEPPMDLHVAAERYLLQMVANGRADNTVAQARRHLALLARWLRADGRSLDLIDIDEETLAMFFASTTARNKLNGTPRSPATVNAIRTSVRVFFAHAARAGWVPRDPSILLKRAVCAPPPPRALTAGEEARLRAVLESANTYEEERDRVLILVMLGTGVRLSSALALTTSDLDLDTGTAVLRRFKGGRVQHAILPRATRDLLAGYIAGRERGPLFTTRAGRPITDRHAHRRIRYWRERAQLPGHVTAHSFRHSVAQRLFDRTKDVLLVKEALHHRSVSSTMRYARTSDAAVRAALES